MSYKYNAGESNSIYAPETTRPKIPVNKSKAKQLNHEALLEHQRIYLLVVTIQQNLSLGEFFLSYFWVSLEHCRSFLFFVS